ncbi:hypothetical protein, partial [Pseudoalteromonas spongiae]|uniref:hypothetical protein n=1 Tax=Pseudoalteromonas spongiae TaxID=298657 RepID=UPI001BB21577
MYSSFDIMSSWVLSIALKRIFVCLTLCLGSWGIFLSSRFSYSLLYSSKFTRPSLFSSARSKRVF